jgi:ssDNA-binding Zn-finger/Zn-ribbon topoisomerase 1
MKKIKALVCIKCNHTELVSRQKERFIDGTRCPECGERAIILKEFVMGIDLAKNTT